MSARFDKVMQTKFERGSRMGEHPECNHDHCESKYDCDLCDVALRGEVAALRAEVAALKDACSELAFELNSTARTGPICWCNPDDDSSLHSPACQAMRAALGVGDK